MGQRRDFTDDTKRKLIGYIAAETERDNAGKFTSFGDWAYDEFAPRGAVDHCKFMVEYYQRKAVELKEGAVEQADRVFRAANGDDIVAAASIGKVNEQILDIVRFVDGLAGMIDPTPADGVDCSIMTSGDLFANTMTLALMDLLTSYVDDPIHHTTRLQYNWEYFDMILGLNADGITDAEYEVLAGLYADMGIKDAEAFIRLLADKTGNVDGSNGYTTWTFDGEKIGNLVKSLDADSAILIQKQHLVRILDNESIEALYAEEFGEGDSMAVDDKRDRLFDGLSNEIFALQHKSALLFAVGILENGVVEYNKFETTKVLDGIIGEKNADNPNIKLTVNENKDFVLSFEQSRIVMDADQRLSSQVITREVKVGYYIDGDSSTSISDKLKSEYYHIKNAYDIDDDLVKKLAQKDVGKFFGLMLKELPFVSLAYDISSILGSVANNKLENDKAVFELTQLEKSEDTANYAALFDLNVNLIYSDPEKPGQTTVLLQNSTATTDILNELNATLEGKFEANPRYFEKYREYGLAYPLSIEDVLNFPKQIRKMEGDMLDSVEHFRIFSYPPVSK